MDVAGQGGTAALPVRAVHYICSVYPNSYRCAKPGGRVLRICASSRGKPQSAGGIIMGGRGSGRVAIADHIAAQLELCPPGVVRTNRLDIEQKYPNFAPAVCQLSRQFQRSRARRQDKKMNFAPLNPVFRFASENPPKPRWVHDVYRVFKIQKSVRRRIGSPP